MLNFCTLFDSNYLSRGLALFESLKKTTPDFHLYIVAFDQSCYEFLISLQEEQLTSISLNDFEDEKLLEVKSGRTPAEYCWTCTPSVILYCIEKFRLPSCTYVDADMIFFDNPRILLDEMTNDSILITEHRYTRDYDVSATHGIYCVQFMYFKNDENGGIALRWWRDRCLEWCFSYLEDGKFGDQKYLDDWPVRFKGVHILKHPGGGMAPWNVQQYFPENKDGKMFISDKKTRNRVPLIFFHFHGLKFYSDEKVACSDALYELSPEWKELVYFPYIRNLIETGTRAVMAGCKQNPHGAKQPAPSSGETIFQYGKNIIFLMLKGRLPVFKKNLYRIHLHQHIYSLNTLNT
jgi:hypothetical protein